MASDDLKLSEYRIAVFGIRIHLTRIRIRIRIQHFRLNTDPDPIRVLMTKLYKNLQVKKLNFLKNQNCYLPFLPKSSKKSKKNLGFNGFGPLLTFYL
jgi:hypothetical protein